MTKPEPRSHGTLDNEGINSYDKPMMYSTTGRQPARLDTNANVNDASGNYVGKTASYSLTGGGTRTVEDAGEHGNALLGKYVGKVFTMLAASDGL